MRMDWIGGLLAVGLALAACSVEESPRDAAPAAPGPPVDAGTDAPAAKTVPLERPAARPEPEADPDPQVGVELPEQPVRVPENPPTG